MKVALIGNMNNMLFTLCRFLRDEGVDARLYMFKNEPFLPEHDSYSLEYEKYTETLPVNSSNFTDKKYTKKLKEKFQKFDYLIGIDIAPALLAFLGLKLNIFIPHGSDIYEFPFIKKKKQNVDEIWWLKHVYLRGKLQKIGIKHVDYIIFPSEYNTHFPFKNKLKTDAKYIDMTIPMVYHPQYKNITDAFLDENFKDRFDKIRSNHDLVVFSHARQNGVSLIDEYKIHDKGNDILITGFAEFVKSNPNVKSCLILFEYGMDVDFSKTLINQLSISENVFWMPKMKRKDIMYGILNSDIGCGQFKNSWLTCGVVNEVLSLGKPLMHYREDSMYTDLYPNLYPILNTQTIEDVIKNLKKYIEDKEHYKKTALKGTDWLNEYTVKKPISFLKNTIIMQNTLSLKRKVTFFVKWFYFSYKLRSFKEKLLRKIIFFVRK